jgi:4-hydroxybenzoate polyprenyltransferase
MLHYLRLLRPLNLIIMVATMYFMRVFVLGDILSENDFQLQMGEFDFALLVLSLVLIAAGGNIINDYFDVRADRVNKPHKVIVGKYVKRRIAMASHIAFNIIGILIGGFLAWKVGMWKLVIIHLFAAGSLWYYSVLFKREFLIGNIVIALLAALVPLAVGLFEIPLVIEAYGVQVHDYFLEVNPEGDPNLFFKILFYFILGFAGFAFLLTLVREIQKDLADVRGDMQAGCKTMPVVLGVRRTKLVVTVLLGVSVILILMVAYYLFGDWITLIYAITAVAIPLGISMWRTLLARDRPDHVAAFTWTKIAMATGLCYAIVFSQWVV